MSERVCPHCVAGLKRMKTRRNWVHWTLQTGVVICTAPAPFDGEHIKRVELED